MLDAPIFCGGCGREIEGCDGRYGDWMHSADRQERCADGALAYPETANQIAARLNARQRKRRTAA